MNVVWIPIVIICAAGTPKSECVETNKNNTVIRGMKQNSLMACLQAAIGTYAAYSNAPTLGQPYEPRFKCQEQHLEN